MPIYPGAALKPGPKPRVSQPSPQPCRDPLLNPACLQSLKLSPDSQTEDGETPQGAEKAVANPTPEPADREVEAERTCSPDQEELSLKHKKTGASVQHPSGRSGEEEVACFLIVTRPRSRGPGSPQPWQVSVEQQKLRLGASQPSRSSWAVVG